MEVRTRAVLALTSAVLVVAGMPRGAAGQETTRTDSITAHVYGGQPFRLDGLTPWRRGAPFQLLHKSSGEASEPNQRFRLKSAPPAREDGAATGGFLSALADALIPVLGITRDQLRDSWGNARVGHSHKGIDIMAVKGTPVVAAVDGSVLKMKWDHGGGRTLRLLDRNQKFVFYYAHLSRYANGLHEGDTVRKGQVVAYVGRTGDAKGAHLHLGIASLLGDPDHWWNARPLNPYTLLKRAFGLDCDSSATRGCGADVPTADGSH